MSSKRQRQFVEKAVNCARMSPVECAKHGAVVVNGKRILTAGMNRYDASKYKSNDSKLYFTDNVKYLQAHRNNKKVRSFTIHAEVDALVRLYRTYPKRVLIKMQLQMYVVRYQGSHLGYSHPCKHCQRFLKQFTRLTVFYS
jgi:deoxycytidylate deaminase